MQTIGHSISFSERSPLHFKRHSCNLIEINRTIGFDLVENNEKKKSWYVISKNTKSRIEEMNDNANYWQFYLFLRGSLSSLFAM